MPIYSSHYSHSHHKEKKAEPVKHEPEKAEQRALKDNKDELKEKET